MAMVEANNEGVLAGGAPEPEADLHRSGIIPQLQNMVATVNLGCKLELKQIALHARNSEYNPKASCSPQTPVCFRVQATNFAQAQLYSSSESVRCPQRFAAVIMRIKEPKTTALVFASGKMVCLPKEAFL